MKNPLPELKVNGPGGYIQTAEPLHCNQLAHCICIPSSSLSEMGKTMTLGHFALLYVNTYGLPLLCTVVNTDALLLIFISSYDKKQGNSLHARCQKHIKLMQLI